ncbi:hypothetical protein PR048_026954 [Dryococelus australis]|uniref:Uncharacterized protein n=1 Tax=Dryococelus australis TaxID=614101 RepID=A0ABQ9GMU2_9NEOP|nr:hypothetical protein PR048_026954 [Dryococelus australis]
MAPSSRPKKQVATTPEYSQRCILHLRAHLPAATNSRSPLIPSIYRTALRPAAHRKNRGFAVRSPALLTYVWKCARAMLSLTTSAFYQEVVFRTDILQHVEIRPPLFQVQMPVERRRRDFAGSQHRADEDETSSGMKARRNRRSLRKPADQRLRPARFSVRKFRERPLRESNAYELWVMSLKATGWNRLMNALSHVYNTAVNIAHARTALCVNIVIVIVMRCHIIASHHKSVGVGKISEVSVEQRRNARVEETGDPRENPPTSGVVQHDAHLRKSGSDPDEELSRFALVGGKQSNRSATAALANLQSVTAERYAVSVNYNARLDGESSHRRSKKISRRRTLKNPATHARLGNVRRERKKSEGVLSIGGGGGTKWCLQKRLDPLSIIARARHPSRLVCTSAPDKQEVERGHGWSPSCRRTHNPAECLVDRVLSAVNSDSRDSR